MNKSEVVIIDYGSGNLRSVAKAIDKAGLNIGTGVSVEIGIAAAQSAIMNVKINLKDMLREIK